MQSAICRAREAHNDCYIMTVLLLSFTNNHTQKYYQ